MGGGQLWAVSTKALSNGGRSTGSAKGTKRPQQHPLHNHALGLVPGMPTWDSAHAFQMYSRKGWIWNTRFCKTVLFESRKHILYFIQYICPPTVSWALYSEWGKHKGSRYQRGKGIKIAFSTVLQGVLLFPTILVWCSMPNWHVLILIYFLMENMSW